VLSTALHVALRDRTVQATRPLTMPVQGRPCVVRARVVPLRDEGVGPHLVVAFEELPDDPAGPAVPSGGSAVEPPERQRHITDLESELAETRANLHATIQDLGTANEELQALNEELMASNEELQGTNEELQSVNEELHTVNAELQGKIEQLDTANADLEGLTRAGCVATVFVDAQLTVLRFTPEAAPLFRLRDSDIGRSLRDMAHTLEYPELFDDLAAALSGRQGRTREVLSHDGRDFLATVLPYGEAASSLAKAVVTFVDVSPLRRAEELQEVLDAQPAHIAVLDRDGIIRRVNRAWRSFAQAHGGDDAAVGVGADYLAQCDAAGQRDAESARIAAELREVLNGHRAGLVRLYPCESRSHTLWFLLHATRLEGRVPGAVVSHLDVTGWLKREPVGGDAAA
jgi:two-component system CheB/CheR fusion protein